MSAFLGCIQSLLVVERPEATCHRVGGIATLVAGSSKERLGISVGFGVSSTPTPFEQMGGDAGIRQLVDRFYDLIDTAPEAATIRKMHAASPH
ncbi:MAG: hypothetical protein ACREBE_09590, partial [bacterium]